MVCEFEEGDGYAHVTPVFCSEEGCPELCSCLVEMASPLPGRSVIVQLWNKRGDGSNLRRLLSKVIISNTAFSVITDKFLPRSLDSEKESVFHIASNAEPSEILLCQPIFKSGSSGLY